MRALARMVFVAAACVLVSAGCDRDPGDISASCEIADWRDVLSDPIVSDFVQARSVTLSASGLTPVQSVRTLDIATDGTLLIADSRSHDLKIADWTGRIVRVIGRKGVGPGEFQSPYDAKFLPSGGIVTVDPENARVSFFDSSGRFESFFIPQAQDPRAVVALSDSLVVVAGLGDVGSRPYVAGRYTRGGQSMAKFLQPDSMVFAVDLVVDQPWITIDSLGTVYGGLTLSPVIHRFEADGDSTCVGGAPPDWNQLRPLEANDRGTMAAMRSWISAATFAVGGGVLNDGRAVFSYSREIRDSTEYRVALFSKTLQPMRLLTSAPGRLVLVKDSRLYFVSDETAGVRLEEWIPVQAAGQRQTSR